jgi:hypothetical protein
MLATNGSYFLQNTDLGNGRSSTLSYKPKYYTGQRIKVNYRIRPMHLPSGYYSSLEEEDDYDDDLLNIQNLNEDDDEEEEEEEEEGISFTQDERDTALRGGGYEPDNNGRSPTLTEFTQDDNMTFQTDGDQQTEKPANMDTANIDDVKITNQRILTELLNRYTLLFNREDRIHNDRLVLIQRIENAVLTIAHKKGDSQEKIIETMNLMLKGNLNNIASQPTLKTRLSNFEQDNGISKTPTPEKGVKPSSSKILNVENVLNEGELKSVFKNISIKYNLNKAFDATLMNTAYIQKSTEMSKLVEVYGKKYNLDNKAICNEMFFRTTQRGNIKIVGMGALTFNLNVLSNELRNNVRTQRIKTPQST